MSASRNRKKLGLDSPFSTKGEWKLQYAEVDRLAAEHAAKHVPGPKGRLFAILGNPLDRWRMAMEKRKK